MFFFVCFLHDKVFKIVSVVTNCHNEHQKMKLSSLILFSYILLCYNNWTGGWFPERRKPGIQAQWAEPIVHSSNHQVTPRVSKKPCTEKDSDGEPDPGHNYFAGYR